METGVFNRTICYVVYCASTIAVAFSPLPVEKLQTVCLFLGVGYMLYAVPKTAEKLLEKLIAKKDS